MSGGIILYLPIFPLLLLGLSHGATLLMMASGAAITLTLLLAGPEGAIVFLFMHLLPAQYFAYKALLAKDGTNGREWYPILRVLAGLTVIASIFLIFLVSFIMPNWASFTTQNLGASEMRQNLIKLDPQGGAELMQWVMGPGKPLIFASMGWIWILTIYGFAALANSLLGTYHLNLRPTIALSRPGLPDWLLPVTCVSAGYALLATGSHQLIGEICFLTFLFPYFLCGLAWLHAASSAWRYRAFWLGAFYLALVTFVLSFWPIVIIISMGLYTQLSEMLHEQRLKR